MLKNNTLKATISNEEVGALSPIVYDGEIVVVTSEAEAKAACADLSSFQMIGFDTETRPSFKAGVSYKVSLLQLSTPTRCYLIRLNKTGLSEEIIELLSNEQVTKIGADVAGDIRSLKQLAHFQEGGFFDLQSIVWEWGVEEKSLRKMVAIILEKKLSKAQRLSNWEAAQLTEQQMQYAAADAWVCCILHEKLLQIEKLSKEQRAEILREQARRAAESAARKAEKAAERAKYRRKRNGESTDEGGDQAKELKNNSSTNSAKKSATNTKRSTRKTSSSRKAAATGIVSTNTKKAGARVKKTTEKKAGE